MVGSFPKINNLKFLLIAIFVLFLLTIPFKSFAQDTSAENAYDAMFDSNVDLGLKEESLFKLVDEESEPENEEAKLDDKNTLNIKEQSLLFNTYSEVGKKIDNDGVFVISLKNEFEESLKIKLKPFEAKDSYKEIFINPYQVISIGEVQAGTYQIELFDVANNFLGYILEDISVDKKIFALNRLKLRSSIDFDDDESIAFEDLQKQALKTIDSDSLKTSSQATQLSNKASLKRSTIQIYNKKKRTVRIANQTGKDLQIDILEAGVKKVGDGWTIGRRIKKPEYLLYNSKRVMIAPNYKLIISEGEGFEPITINAKELEINKQGDYLLIIGP